MVKKFLKLYFQIKSNTDNIGIGAFNSVGINEQDNSNIIIRFNHKILSLKDETVNIF